MSRQSIIKVSTNREEVTKDSRSRWNKTFPLGQYNNTQCALDTNP